MYYAFYISGKASKIDSHLVWWHFSTQYDSEEAALADLKIFRAYASLKKDITLQLKELDTPKVISTHVIEANRKMAPLPKNIAISEQNKAKINLILTSIEGRARERTINYSDIIGIIQQVESLCNHHNLKGMQIHRTGRRLFAKAYKYTPMSTHFLLKHNGTCWQLITASIKRDACPRNSGEPFEVKFTRAALRAILNAKIGKYCASFCKLSEDDIID